jgi:N-acetylneuraminate lyase
MSFSEFRLIAAPHAPLNGQGELDVRIVERQAELLLRGGVAGVFVAGTTGECSSLTEDERVALARRWLDVAAGTELEVLVQVGHNCQSLAVELAAQAQQAGADGIAALAPCYFKPETVDDLIEFLAPIAAAAGDLPFYYYDIPVLTNVRLSMVELLRSGKERIPNLVGLKYSNPDLVQLQECVQLEGGQFEVLFGCDEMLLAGATLGARGAVGSSYNFAAPLFRQMFEALDRGDWPAAREQQFKSVRLIRALQRYGFLAASKAAMAIAGVDCGPVRPPLRTLTNDAMERLREELEALDVLCETAMPEVFLARHPAAESPT